MKKKIITPSSRLSWLNNINWGKLAKLSVGLWIIIQVVLIIVFWNVDQRSDQGAYLDMANDYFSRGSWYPDIKELYSTYIWAPGLINMFIAELHIFGSLKANYFINLILNICILWNVWLLANRFFSKRTAYISVILFCFTYSNIMVVLPAGTEMPFLALAISAFSLCLSNKSIRNLIIAGILLALANWIRPLVITFIPVILLYMFLNKSKASHYIALIVPMIVLTLSFGWMAKKQLGHFCFQSTTSGVNLIMTANDKAYGGVATSLLGDSTSSCHIKDANKYTYIEKDSIWKARSIEWIKEHPFKFTGLYFAKIAGLYVEDSWAERPIIGGDGFVDKAAHGKADKMAIIKRVLNMLGKSIVYYVILCLSIISLFKYRKEILSDKGYIILICILGTLATCIFSVTPRYHYPFLFALTIWAAYGVDKFLIKREAE